MLKMDLNAEGRGTAGKRFTCCIVIKYLMFYIENAVIIKRNFLAILTINNATVKIQYA